MGYFSTQIITAKGIELLATAELGNIKLVFTKIKTGDGSYTTQELTEIKSATGLKSLKQEFQITSAKLTGDNMIRLKTTLTNENVSSGYYIREIGVFAKADNGSEQLISISYCNDNPTYMSDSDTPFVATLNNYLAHSSDQNITIDYAAGAYVSIDDYEELKSSFATQINSLAMLNWLT